MCQGGPRLGAQIARRWVPLTRSAPPALNTNVYYLVLVETTPEPIRVWHVTRSDILWFAGNGDNYLTIFPTPFAP
jgi:hypothetical protein